MRLLVHGLVAASIIVLFGTLLHEGGHALVALLSGGGIEEVVVSGVRIYPDVGFDGEPRSFGHVLYARALEPIPNAWSRVAGSGTTALVGLIAFLLWHRSSRKGVLGTAQLACIALLFDAFCHSLPWVGIPMFVVFGRPAGQDPQVSELVAGSIALGVPEPLTLTLVFALPIVAFAVVLRSRTRIAVTGRQSA